MVSLNPNSPDPRSDPQARKKLAEQLAEGAMIMAGFGPPEEKAPEPPPAPQFELGGTYATAAVTRWAEQEKIDLSYYLARHHCGDWGDLDPEDKKANEEALETGARILSCYRTQNRKIYCITEADRSMTTVLFACEY